MPFGLPIRALFRRSGVNSYGRDAQTSVTIPAQARLTISDVPLDMAQLATAEAPRGPPQVGSVGLCDGVDGRCQTSSSAQLEQTTSTIVAQEGEQAINNTTAPGTAARRRKASSSSSRSSSGRSSGSSLSSDSRSQAPHDRAGLVWAHRKASEPAAIEGHSDAQKKQHSPLRALAPPPGLWHAPLVQSSPMEVDNEEKDDAKGGEKMRGNRVRANAALPHGPARVPNPRRQHGRHCQFRLDDAQARSAAG